MIGPRVAERRRAAGFTQAELAYRAGLHPQTISDIERGKADNPTLSMLTALSLALGCTIADLLGEAEPAPSEAAR